MSYIWMKSFNDYGSSEATELNIINYVDNPKVLEYVNELVNSSSSLDWFSFPYIFILLHFAIGENGKLTGFAYGTEAKRWLLELEVK